MHMQNQKMTASDFDKLLVFEFALKNLPKLKGAKLSLLLALADRMDSRNTARFRQIYPELELATGYSHNRVAATLTELSSLWIGRAPVILKVRQPDSRVAVVILPTPGEVQRLVAAGNPESRYIKSLAEALADPSRGGLQEADIAPVQGM